MIFTCCALASRRPLAATRRHPPAKSPACARLLSTGYVTGRYSVAVASAGGTQPYQPMPSALQPSATSALFSSIDAV